MKLILQMVGLSIVMILAGSAAFVCGIMLSLDNIQIPVPVGVTGMLAGSVIAVGSFWWIIKLNTAWVQDFRGKFESEPDALLAQWTIPLDRWQTMAAHEKEQAQQFAPYLGGCLGLVTGGIALFTLWATLGPALALAVGVGGGCLLAIAVWQMAIWSSGRTYRTKRNQTKASIAIRADGMLINGRAIAWGGIHGSLETFTFGPIDGLDFPVLTVAVRRQTGSDSILHTYHVPLPDDDGQLIRRRLEARLARSDET